MRSIYRKSQGGKDMTKANERENRSEQERFLDRMLKEISAGGATRATGCRRRANWPRNTACARRTCILVCKSWSGWAFEVVPRHATYVAPYWEKANLETLAAIMTHGGKPHPELVDAFLELREMVALGWFRWMSRNPKTEQMRHLYGLLERMEAIAYAPDGEKDKPEFLDLVNQFLVCMFASRTA